MIVALNQKINIVLYCHNLYGLGHIIRSTRIAKALFDSGRFSPVLLTGCRALDSIHIPEGIVIEKLTPLSSDFFDLKRYDIQAERIKHIQSFINNFKPQIVLVDTVPLGYDKELKALLLNAKIELPDTLFVLGLPYAPKDGFEPILKNPEDKKAINAYSYGIKYGDDEWNNEYDKLDFQFKDVGAIAGEKPPKSAPDSNAILIIGGGGTVSASMLKPIIKATQTVRLKGYHVKFVIGPLANYEKMQNDILDVSNFKLIKSSSIEEALLDAKIVISRCGYNSAVALVRTTLPIIFIPYDESDSGKGEQFVRARKLKQIKNIQMVNPLDNNLDTELEKAINIALESDAEERQCPYSVNGTEETLNYLTNIINGFNLDNSNNSVMTKKSKQ